MMRRLLMIAVFGAAAGCGDQHGPPVVAASVVVTGPAAAAPMAAGYLEISNRSGADIRITRVSSPQYESVEIHETVVENDIARMREIPALEIGRGETVVFERGGKHLMLMKPVGTPGPVTLNFYSDGTLLLVVDTEFAATMD
jgi:copper(I)-binding protein